MGIKIIYKPQYWSSRSKNKVSRDNFVSLETLLVFACVCVRSEKWSSRSLVTYNFLTLRLSLYFDNFSAFSMSVLGQCLDLLRLERCF